MLVDTTKPFQEKNLGASDLPSFYASSHKGMAQILLIKVTQAMGKSLTYMRGRDVAENILCMQEVLVQFLASPIENW